MRHLALAIVGCVALSACGPSDADRLLCGVGIQDGVPDRNAESLGMKSLTREAFLAAVSQNPGMIARFGSPEAVRRELDTGLAGQPGADKMKFYSIRRSYETSPGSKTQDKLICYTDTESCQCIPDVSS